MLKFTNSYWQPYQKRWSFVPSRHLQVTAFLREVAFLTWRAWLGVLRAKSGDDGEHNIHWTNSSELKQA